MTQQLVAVLVAVMVFVGPAMARDGDAGRGRELAKRWCATCHVIDVRGTGIAVDPAPPFPSMAGRTPDALRGAMNRPHVQMPQFDLGRREVDDLIAYIRLLGAKR